MVRQFEDYVSMPLCFLEHDHLSHSFFVLSLLHLLTCVYIVWATSPDPILGRTCSTLLFSDFVEEKTRKTMLLLVWDKDSYTEIPSIASMHKYITTHIGSSLPDLSLLPGPLPIVLDYYIRLYQPHSTLGFLPFLYSSRVHSPLSVWPMSNNITAFVLGL
jgi:hypothetical protein